MYCTFGILLKSEPFLCRPTKSLSSPCSNENGQDIEKGPFDPDAAAEEQETMRSSAFDASEKPVVGGKLKASAIAVIGDGLGAKLKTGPPQLDIIGDTKDGSADVDGMTRSSREGSLA